MMHYHQRYLQTTQRGAQLADLEELFSVGSICQFLQEISQLSVGIWHAVSHMDLILIILGIVLEAKPVHLPELKVMLLGSL